MFVLIKKVFITLLNFIGSLAHIGKVSDIKKVHLLTTNRV